MKILCHRGVWQKRQEGNSMSALERALRIGFGFETDIRDRRGQVVISHDSADDEAALLAEILEVYRREGADDLTLALNIKADGLQDALVGLLERFSVRNYFVFDMSIPDHLRSLAAGLRTFTRQSEFEPEPLLYEQSAGVWLDCFQHEWMTAATIESHLRAGKEVCLVSPELHGRPHQPMWEMVRAAGLDRDAGIMLCTDLPDRARSFFDA